MLASEEGTGWCTNRRVSARGLPLVRMQSNGCGTSAGESCGDVSGRTAVEIEVPERYTHMNIKSRGEQLPKHALCVDVLACVWTCWHVPSWERWTVGSI